jgi:DNA-binding beta-propeller fold protein YncE
LEEAEARSGALGGAQGGRRGKNRKGRDRKRSRGLRHSKKKHKRRDKKRNDQGFVFVGSTTEVRGPDGLAVGGERLFVANAGSNAYGVQYFGINTNGQLTLQGTLPDTFNIADAVAVDAAGRLYVADFLGFVRVYAIGDDGIARRIAEIRGVPNANGVAVAGRFLYIASQAQNNLHVYHIVDGAPPTYEPVATIGDLNKPAQLASEGGRLYVADAGNHRVQVYGIDSRTGAATLKQTLPVSNPRGIAAGGGQLYVSCSRPGDSQRSRVQVFDLDADGMATPGLVLTQGDKVFRDPRGVSIGRGFLFVADTGNNRIQVFRIP